jgi:hypothetical protein
MSFSWMIELAMQLVHFFLAIFPDISSSREAHPLNTAIVPFLENSCNKQPLTSLNKVWSKQVVS